MALVTARDWFDFYYRAFSEEGSPRFMSDDDIVTALTVALDYVPQCAAVTATQKLQAQAHYAAYELGLIFKNRQAGSGFSEASVLIKEREGDVERAWSAPKTVTADIVTGDDSPLGRWQALANLCPPAFNGFSLRSVRI